jgi:hypothetical protein
VLRVRDEGKWRIVVSGFGFQVVEDRGSGVEGKRREW